MHTLYLSLFSNSTEREPAKLLKPFCLLKYLEAFLLQSLIGSIYIHFPCSRLTNNRHLLQAYFWSRLHHFGTCFQASNHTKTYNKSKLADYWQFFKSSNASARGAPLKWYKDQYSINCLSCFSVICIVPGYAKARRFKSKRVYRNSSLQTWP